MKKMIYRLAALAVAWTMVVAASAKTQDYSGKVIDEKGQPVAFVNVVLLSLPDSAFVQGAVSDEQGAFHIVTNVSDGLLKLSSVGYETLFVKAANGLTITMKEDAQMLGEVVVKSQLPKTLVKGDAMRTTVAGTILEKAGTVNDALSKIPSLEAERDGGVKVLGRGDAEVYINGRRVQDNSELSRLRSDQIQHVDVIQNPGARYAASTKAVVRITLKKAQGEGFSFQDNLSGMYQYGHTLTNNLDVNYRMGGLDITASLWAGRYGHTKSLQENTLTYYAGPDKIEGVSTQESKNIWKGWSPQLQVNYMLDENHSFGAFYKYDRHPSGDFNSMFYTDSYENGIFKERSESHITQVDMFRKHIFNAYYNGKVGQLSIDLNVDGLFDDTQSPSNTQEKTLPQPLPAREGSDYSRENGKQAARHFTPLPSREGQEGGSAGGGSLLRSIESTTVSSNNFWASKLIFGYPVWQGNFSLGGEYTYNHRTDAYDFMATDAVPVKTTDTEINETSAAVFAEYGRQFGKVFTQVGLRYEHLTNDYFNFGKKEGEVCRNYGDWFPTVVISAPVGKVQLSLSYRRDIERPNYANLTSSTVYINRYTYQSGNPYLKPTYTHSLVLNGAYKWMNLTLNYARIKDAETMSTEPYPGSADPFVSLVRPINSQEDYDRLTIVASARPNFQFSIFNSQLKWHPTWSVVAMFQNYKTPIATGEVITLSQPWFNGSWRNTIELPHALRLSVDVEGATKGDYNNFHLTKPRIVGSLGLQKDFNLRRLGSLTADLRCIDIFNTNKTDAIIYGYRDLTVHNPARRTFTLDLTWKFNEARSKYRGSGAGEKQKARM